MPHTLRPGDVVRILDEDALARCASRLREIESSEHISAGRPTLGFAVLWR